MKKVKAFIAFILLLLAINTEAASLRWEAVASTANCTIEGYEVFVREENGEFDWDNPAWTGSALSVDMDTLNCEFLPNVRYYFVVRAVSSDSVPGPESGQVGDVRLYQSRYDGESLDGIVVYDSVPNTPVVPMITSQQDDELNDNVYVLTSNGLANAFRFGSNMLNTVDFFLSAKVNFAEDFRIYCDVETDLGKRFIIYGTDFTSTRINGSCLEIKIDSSFKSGTWKHLVCGLVKDFERFFPNNYIIQTNQLYVRGGGKIAELKLQESEETLYESCKFGGGNATKWEIIDNDPEGATLSTVIDTTTRAYATKMVGTGLQNCYKLTNKEKVPWHNTSQFCFSTEFRFTEAFWLIWEVQTDSRDRLIIYQPGNFTPYILGGEVHFPIDASLIGSRKTLKKNMQKDLETALRIAGLSTEKIVEVNSLMVRGSGEFYEVSLMSRLDIEVYGESRWELNTAWSVSDSDPAGASIVATDDIDLGKQVVRLNGTGLLNSFALKTATGTDWENYHQRFASWRVKSTVDNWIYWEVTTDIRTRYLIYTSSASSMSVSGAEVKIGVGVEAKNGYWQLYSRNLQEDLDAALTQASLPGETIISVNKLYVRGGDVFLSDITLSDYPSCKVYEEVINSRSINWSVIDNDPTGASIAETFDYSHGRKVVKLTGTGLSNAFQLTGDSGESWGNTTHFFQEFKVRSAEEFWIYLDIDTVDSSQNQQHRYLIYKSKTMAQYASGSEIFIGLGNIAMTDTWLAYFRDLQSDLATSFPGETVKKVNKIMFRGGNILVTDIKAHQFLP